MPDLLAPGRELFYSNGSGIDSVCQPASGPYPDTSASMCREWSLRIRDQAGLQ